MLGLNKAHKELLMITTTEERCCDLQDKLNDYFMFEKRNKGIAFSIPFLRWELKSDKETKRNVSRDFDSSYYCIMTIVDKGKGKDCIDASKSAGARGGTLVHGHGAGVPKDYYYPLMIEPQKDLVMILTEKDNATTIKDRIVTDLELYKERKGIIFILPILKMSGLVENKEVRV